MTPFELFIITACIIMGIIFLIIAYAAGTFAKIEGNRPPMSARIIDFTPLEHDGDPTVFFLKYHPKSGHYLTPLKASPVAHGLARVVLKEGLYGWRQRERTIEEGRLRMPKNLKGGYGTYKADLVQLRLREQLDRQQHTISDLMLKLNESQRTVEVLSRNQKEEIQQGIDTFTKNAIKLGPALPPKRTSGSGR